MSIINYHESCVGIVLFKWRQKFIQLWYCPKGYEIKPHSHPEEDIELMYLFGSTVFYRQNQNINYIIRGWLDNPESYKPKWYNVFRRFSVPANTKHWFIVSKWPLIFINFSTFSEGNKPKSAAVDFKE